MIHGPTVAEILKQQYKKQKAINNEIKYIVRTEKNPKDAVEKIKDIFALN